MAIHALSPATVRTIGSAQALTDPASLVKELLDNALDARATTVSIEIHSDTLSWIQVRDNGHGILPDDRELVARRYCTSKIQNEQDLTQLGGTWLGFRGEALSSAAELSGSLSITTRIEGEEVATALIIAPNGEVTEQSRASHPIGTTVKVTDFLKTQPVRKQVAAKNATRTLTKIKHTCQAYAIARAAVRLSFRVVKTKNDKGNWTYGPKAGGSIEDAATKVVGQACASQCVWTTLEADMYTVQAFLPRSDAVSSRISGLGQFFAIDSRPVSPARGTLREIAKMYKDRLKQVLRADGLKDPFLCLHLRCPPGSYDPNVEPAKDDVMFEDPQKVLDLVRAMLDTAYPVEAAPEPEHTSEMSRLLDQERQSQARSTTELRNNQNTPSVSTLSAGKKASKRSSAEHPVNAFRSNMYSEDEDMEEDLEMPQPKRLRTMESLTLLDTEADLYQASHDPTLSNPWTLAKMNTPLQSSVDVSTKDSQLSALGQRRALAGLTSSPPQQAKSIPPRGRALLTPCASSPAPLFEHSAIFPDSRTIDPRPMPSPKLYTPQSSFRQPAPVDLDHSCPGRSVRDPPNDDISHSPSFPGPARSLDFVSARQLPLGTPLELIPDVTSRRRSPRKPLATTTNKHFVSPIADPNKVWFDTPAPLKAPQRKAAAESTPSSTESLVVQGDLRDFLSRTDAGGAEENTRNPDKSTRPRRRRTSEPRVLGEISGNGIIADDAEEAEEDADITATHPRRRQRSEGAEEYDVRRYRRSRRTTSDSAQERPHRTKSSRLPLERVPVAARVQNVVLALPTTTLPLIAKMSHLLPPEDNFVGWNEPALDAYDAFALLPERHEVDVWEGRLRGMCAVVAER
ncbi:hypothetical protein LTR66_008856 [Elasticomyces elasticus]|nr:hypothetical protein LTR66_008856 [Elasticomyces elasticus]